MKICILGDSVSKGVLLDPQQGRYICGRSGFADRLDRLENIEVENFSVFGCTVSKGLRLAERHSAKLEGADAVLLEFGGNDCDFHWTEIAADPEREHMPNTPMEEYLEDYARLIYAVESRGALPVPMNLPPIHAQSYFNWFSRDMDEREKANIVTWLHGDIEYIHRWHKSYNDQLTALTDSLGAKMADIRSDFCAGGNYSDFLCADGIHPNEAGQELIFSSLKSLGSNKTSHELI